MKKNVVLITALAPTHKEAERIADVLLDKHLADIVQIQMVSSHYWRNKERKREQEALIMIQTQSDRVETLIKELLELLPADIPEILVHDTKTYQHYQEWLQDELKKNSCCPD